MAGDRDEKARRINASAELVERAKAFSKVKYDARMGVLHDELMEAVDAAVADKQAGRAPFTQTQVEVLKDVAFQLVYLLHPDGHRRPGLIRACWSEFVDQKPLQKLTTIFVVVSTVAASTFGVWKAYREIKDYYLPEKPAIAQPAAPAAPVNPFAWPPVQLPPPLQPGPPPPAR